MTTDTISTDQQAFSDAMNRFFADLGGTVGVMAHDFGTGLELTYNHMEVFPIASTLKTPLLYELYRLADAGEVDLSERITLRHAHRTPGSGIFQSLDEGLRPTLRDLAELMIIVSDNWATDIIYGRIGKERMARTLRDLELHQTHIPLNIREMFCALAMVDPDDPTVDYEFLRDHLKNTVSPPESVGYACDPRNDISTPADMVLLMRLIEEGHNLSPESREAIIRTLKNQNVTNRIPARLPLDRGIEPAHKTGSLRGIRNDVGIVYSPTINYAVAFMSKDQADTAETVDRMARASRWIWDYLSEHNTSA
jgi:beta-lactamase class A